jgi:hypothetical protein
MGSEKAGSSFREKPIQTGCEAFENEILKKIHGE